MSNGKPKTSKLAVLAVCFAVAAAACMVLVNLMENLGEPRHVSSSMPAPVAPADFLPLPPFVTAPLQPRFATLVPAPIRPWLPPVEAPAGSHLLASERNHPPRLRSPVDVPELAGQSDAAPARQALPVRALVRAATPDLADLPILPVEGRTPGRTDPASASQQDTPRQPALSATPHLREGPTPFVRLTIPDPFETVTRVHLRQFPPDDDPPASISALSPKPTLPVKP